MSAFEGRAEPIPEELRRRMRGRSWRDDPRCPLFAELSLLRMTHWGFDGAVHEGQLVVAARFAEPLLHVFARIFRAAFPIERMHPVDEYGADDEASMAANNCSAFNFRPIAGTRKLSQHSYGTAIDINPVQNPMITPDGRVHPEAGRGYLDRSDVRPGMIVRPGPVIAAFESIGWIWGGDWDDLRDYHHFARTRR